MPSGASDAPIYLVGMMGAGKSAAGERLARALGRRFVDLDALTEEWAGETIADLFAQGREQEFRELERSALRGFDALGTVVATGGGTVIHAPNVEYMLARGRVAYLRARPETLAARVTDQARPLLAGCADEAARQARLAALLAERQAAYARAHYTVDTDGLALDDVVDALRRWAEDAGARGIDG